MAGSCPRPQSSCHRLWQGEGQEQGVQVRRWRSSHANSVQSLDRSHPDVAHVVPPHQLRRQHRRHPRTGSGPPHSRLHGRSTGCSRHPLRQLRLRPIRRRAALRCTTTTGTIMGHRCSRPTLHQHDVAAARSRVGHGQRRDRPSFLRCQYLILPFSSSYISSRGGRRRFHRSRHHIWSFFPSFSFS